MMRVVQMMSGGAQGGAEGFFERLVGAFHKHSEIEQHVIIRYFEDRVERLAKQGIPVQTLPFGSLIDVYTPWKLKQSFKKSKPDIVMTWMSRATLKCPKGPYKIVARLGGYYPLKYYKHCDYWIGNTQDIADYLIKEGCPKDRVAYLPNFVEEQEGKLLNRVDFNTPNDVPLFLGLGRLHPNKGFDVLIKALALTEDAHLWIAGEGDLKPSLQKLAEDMGVANRIRFLGWRKDSANLLKTVDSLVCSSRHEPLGNIVLEAWAQKTPVIACASQGPKSLIRNAENGFLVPIDDVDALGHCLQDFCSSEGYHNSLIQKAYDDYYHSFSKEKIVDQYLNFFKKII
jgi:glycosyltransferase involved in cell wall biosynthesis